jgi:hypothetical protein
MKITKRTLVFFVIVFSTLTLIAVTVFFNNILQVFSGAGIAFLVKPFLDAPKKKEAKKP